MLKRLFPDAGDRALAIMLALVATIGGVAGLPLSAEEPLAMSGYAEWRPAEGVIVDGQHVRVDEHTKWKGAVASIKTVSLGHEIRLKGVRQEDGSVLAREMDVRPNGRALLENVVEHATDELEGVWLRSGRAFETDGVGHERVIGAIVRSGPMVDRLRRLVDRLAPPYLDRSKLRVYVVENAAWNAMAMGNGSIWVFRGLMNDLSDDELAIIVGHELAHYTHEHPRRQMWRGIGAQVGHVATLLAAAAIDSTLLRAATEAASRLGFTAWTNAYGRELEDQADRVGLRYAYEAGFDVARAPGVWQRFVAKYGEADRVTTFFFSDHSRASARGSNLERELRTNYTTR